MTRYPNTIIAPGGIYHPRNWDRAAQIDLIEWRFCRDLDRYLEIKECNSSNLSILWRTPLLKQKCLERSCIAYRDYLRYFSHEEANIVILKAIERWFWGHDRNKGSIIRIGVSGRSILSTYELTSIWEDLESFFKRGLHRFEERAQQRNSLEKLAVMNDVTEAPASEQAPASILRKGAHVPREQDSLIAYKGATWEITFEGKKGTLRDSNGVRFLVFLLVLQGKKIHAKELYGLAMGELRKGGTELESVDPMMDKTAMNKIEHDLEKFELERKSAEAAGSENALLRIEQERGSLLAAAIRISHPKARHNSGTEKARKNVSNQVAQTIRKLAEIPGLRPLAEHLENSMRKGEFLSYQGGLRWMVELPPARKSAAKCS
jgi:hypothetical protein